MSELIYYRGTMTDGHKMSTDIFDLKHNGVNTGFLKDPKNAKWYETPLSGIRFAETNEVWPDEYSYITDIDQPYTYSLRDFAYLLRDAAHRFWIRILEEGEKYICFHSGGYDSRIMSLTLMELRDAGFDELTRNIHFRCHQPEEPMFLEIMKRQGWPQEQYSVYEGPQEDYYNIGRIEPMNGWQHYNQQMNFWGDIIKDESEYNLITGLGGELFKYFAFKVKANSQRVKNNALNILIDHYPHEGQWEGYWRRKFKELIMPFWSYEYLQQSTRVRPEYCTHDGESDSVRKAIVETYIHSHGVDCLNIEYGRHDYSWNISEKRKQQMLDFFYSCKLYNEYKELMPDNLDLFDMKLRTVSRTWHAPLWGFAATYEFM